MKIHLDTEELLTTKNVLQSIIKAASLKEAEIKEHSTEHKILTTNREIAAKVDWLLQLIAKPEYSQGEVELELNRIQAKVLATSLVTISTIQLSVLGEYEKRPEDHKSFAPSIAGRSKTDYIQRLHARMQMIGDILVKVRKEIGNG